MKLSREDLKAFLEEKTDRYNRSGFIAGDPVSIPHLFTQKEDIEIAGFLTASIAWGNRNSILASALRMIRAMGNRPYDFVMHCRPDHLRKIEGTIHRTFHADDLGYFIQALRHIYQYHHGPEAVFYNHQTADSLQPAIHAFRKLFFELPHPARTRKHIADPLTGSAAKRINLFLRWMVRRDNRGVDFGIWNTISPSILSCPLDVHSGRIARKLGLLTRHANDDKAVRELDGNLRLLDPADPVKYDFALFGLGLFEDFAGRF